MLCLSYHLVSFFPWDSDSLRAKWFTQVSTAIKLSRNPFRVCCHSRQSFFVIISSTFCVSPNFPHVFVLILKMSLYYCIPRARVANRSLLLGTVNFPKLRYLGKYLLTFYSLSIFVVWYRFGKSQKLQEEWYFLPPKSLKVWYIMPYFVFS